VANNGKSSSVLVQEKESIRVELGLGLGLKEHEAKIQ